ncbi:hypothetical protein A5742_17200 [Mycolicibacterium fortuitum]|uniref:Uncharacterized protein n=1 Tax=Mycolicibacterium fortuitum TaxID=1766 RepID=A0ABD6QTB5_MYCFO|nr:hypothetical protein A5742_17200 [Mycolicibacterium fortuitum]
MWIIGVFTPDGSTALTVMPYSITSRANDFTSADRGGRDDVAHHNVGAFASEREGMRTPLPTRSPGDQGRPAVQRSRTDPLPSIRPWNGDRLCRQNSSTPSIASRDTGVTVTGWQHSEKMPTDPVFLGK